MILVTGATGFIGRYFCEHLLKQGKSVIGIDNFVTSSKDSLKGVKTYSNFTFINASIEDILLEKRLSSFNISNIYHFACPTGVPNLKILSEEMLIANSRGTENILRIANKNKAKILIASSSEVYGDPLIFPQPEEYCGNVESLGIRSPYEEGKRFSEALAVMFYRKYKLHVKIARIFNTFGPNPFEKDIRVIPNFLRKSKNNEDLLIYGDGKQKRTFLYIDDLIPALELIMEKALPGSVLNVGSDKEIAILDLAKLVIDLTNSKSKLVYKIDNFDDPKGRLPFLDKIHNLGWEQKTSLEEGIKRCL